MAEPASSITRPEWIWAIRPILMRAFGYFKERSIRSTAAWFVSTTSSKSMRPSLPMFSRRRYAKYSKAKSIFPGTGGTVAFIPCRRHSDGETQTLLWKGSTGHQPRTAEGAAYCCGGRGWLWPFDPDQPAAGLARAPWLSHGQRGPEAFHACQPRTGSGHAREYSGQPDSQFVLCNGFRRPVGKRDHSRPPIRLYCSCRSLHLHP